MARAFKIRGVKQTGKDDKVITLRHTNKVKTEDLDNPIRFCLDCIFNGRTRRAAEVVNDRPELIQQLKERYDLWVTFARNAGGRPNANIMAGFQTFLEKVSNEADKRARKQLRVIDLRSA